MQGPSYLAPSGAVAAERAIADSRGPEVLAAYRALGDQVASVRKAMAGRQDAFADLALRVMASPSGLRDK